MKLPKLNFTEPKQIVFRRFKLHRLKFPENDGEESYGSSNRRKRKVILSKQALV